MIVGKDLIEPYDGEYASQESVLNMEGFQWTVVLRKWHPNHNKGMEFRCFVRDCELIGIAQKDDTAHYKFLQEEGLLGTVYERIKDLVYCSVNDVLEDESYILDVYIDIAPKHKAWV